MPQAAAPASPGRRWRLFTALVAAGVIVIATLSVYVLTRPPPIPLTVSDGSLSKIIEATFADYQDTGHPIFRVYTATTYANQSDGASSRLTLRLFVVAFDAPPRGATLGMFAIVSGRFAPNLSPTRLTFTFNQTGRYASAYGYAYPTAFNNSLPNAPIAFPGPTNVTYEGAFLPQVVGTGSSSIGSSFLNESKAGPSYDFLYPAYIEEVDPLGDDAFLAIRATVMGPFTPAVSVGILVHLVNIPVTFTHFFAKIERSVDRSRWYMNITSVGGAYSNTSIYLRVRTLDGVTVVPATPLGSLYRTPYNESIEYAPATLGSSAVNIGDVLAFSAAMYGENYLIQILLNPGASDTILFQATLG
jgi:hypothetical protein